MRSLAWSPLILVVACNTPPPLQPLAPPLPITVFRADADEFPEVAAALNRRIEGVYPPGPTVHYAAVTLEDAQLAVGCVDATPECWSSLADPVSTSALLAAEARGEGRKGAVRLSLRLFDAAAQKTVRLSERVYGDAAAALEGVPWLVAGLAAPREEP